MRLGTWNLAGRWDARHRDLIEALDCDVLLLTEVPERVQLDGHDLHLGELHMAPERRWAAVASRLGMTPLPDPHGASAMAEVEGLRVCSSVLPWRTCGTRPPWSDGSTAVKTAATVAAVMANAPTIWGGDWNHALSGKEYAGSRAGRQVILAAVARLGLQVPTADLLHQVDGLFSIDHIAVPRSWRIVSRLPRPATAGGAQLSDHDAYVIEVDRP